MISANSRLVPVSSIVVDWETRYDLDDFDEAHARALADDFIKRDIIHLPVIEEGTNRLLVGGHRLRGWQINAESGAACPKPQYKKWTLIPVRFAKNFSTEELAHIELVENIRHRVLPWDVRAIKIAEIHRAEQSTRFDQTMDETAVVLGCSRREIQRSVRISQALAIKGPLEESLRACATLSAAFNILERQDQREKANEIEKLTRPNQGTEQPEHTEPQFQSDTSFPEEAETETRPKLQEGVRMFDVVPILHLDFADFNKEYEGQRFNLIHADPPYGVGMQKANAQGGRKDWQTYEDSVDDYWAFMQTLVSFSRKHMAASSHIILWFSLNQFEATLRFLAKEMLDWKVEKFPLIWYFSDSTGLCPDPQRYGRRNYETALVLSRGDRKIVRVKNLAFSHPKKWEGKIHQSEKPIEMVRYFLSMFVDKHTIFLDPTCGSGTALRAADVLGAPSILALERNKKIYQTATDAWNHYATSKQIPLEI